MAQSTGILILGMHRSGTSALARVVNLLGAELGDKLLPAAADNERGFWEEEEIVALHERMLTDMRSNWDDLLPIEPELFDALNKPVAELEILIKRLYGKTRLWAVKDPRLSLLLPAWNKPLQSLGSRNVAILCLRHPTEVAASLAKRDGLAIDSGLALWLHYTLMAEYHTRRLTRIVLSYDDLLNNWKPTMERAASALSFSWPVPITAIAHEIESFLTTDLRHNRAQQEITGPEPWASWSREIYESLSKGAIDTALFDRIRHIWQESLTPIVHQIKPLRDELITIDTELHTLRHTVNDLTNQHAQLESSIGSAWQAADDERKTAQRQTSALSDTIAQQHRYIQKLHHSLSWKLTAPLRLAKRMMIRNKENP